MKWAIPAGLAAFDVVEAVICLAQKDYARAWYWLAAAQITVATIFMGK